MAGWCPLDELTHWELVQSREEGKDVADLAARYAALMGAGAPPRDDPAREAVLRDLCREAQARPIVPGFPHREPDALDEIRGERPPGPRVLGDRSDDAVMGDRFHGAWLGRAVGCSLGLPLEVDPFTGGLPGRPGWRCIQLWFEGADAWPIAGYTPRASRAEPEHGLLVRRERGACREDLKAMETDDDIRYTVLGLLLLERHGFAFDAWDVGKLWHEVLPYGAVCTAETQAYLNFARATSHLGGAKPADFRARLDRVRTDLNPFREWIGAQIRADAYGYAAACRPELAARLAWQDASFSHVKNGVYGAMFCAAMIAAAFGVSDARALVDIGLSEIPATSRLAVAVRRAVAIAESSSTQLELVERIEREFNGCFWVHAVNNAALVAASLVFARGDFEKAVTTAVLGGWDTDCNGATVGSVMGAMVGAAGIPARWREPLNDTLYSGLPGFHPIRISACGARSHTLWQRLAQG